MSLKKTTANSSSEYSSRQKPSREASPGVREPQYTIKSPVLFVGAGPGDPELITVKGQNALKQADVIIYAGSLVPETLLQWANPGVKVLNSASMHLEEIIKEIETAFAENKRVESPKAKAVRKLI